jgi:GT2 family glycosyltransferase
MKFVRSLGQEKTRQNYDIIKLDFEETFYLETYSDAAKSNLDPIEHYLKIGSKLGYKPRHDFDPIIYMENYPDVKASGMEPFVHYIKHGKSERRSTLKSRINTLFYPSLSDDYAVVKNEFDHKFYINTYRDVAKAGVDPLKHYLCHGWREGRKPRATFDTDFYLSRYTDVVASGVNPFVHYVKQGRSERRITFPVQINANLRRNAPLNFAAQNPPLQTAAPIDAHRLLFDENWYLSRYPDVMETQAEPLHHFLDRGARQGRDPHPLFHTRFYLSQVEDCEEAIADPVSHYMKNGSSLGFSPHPLFDRIWYRFGNQDLLGDEFVQFLVTGDREGRSSHPLFDPLFYLRNNADVAASGVGPLQHFVAIGGLECRNPHPMFDSQYYYWLHPEARKQKVNPLVHYLLQPRELRRHPHPLFDGSVQRMTSALARETSIDPLTDYVQFRSTLDPELVARHTTYIPAPLRAILPSRLPTRKPIIGAPLVSVIMPAYNSEEKYFSAAVNSVRAQTYSNWELIIVDDGSSMPHVEPMIERIARLDKRIRHARLDTNSGIAAATNAGLKIANGEFVALVDHDDVLLPVAIEDMARVLIEEQADAAYSDQAYLSAWNTFDSAFYKPDWSPVLFSGVMYVGHLLMVRREVADAAGGFNPSFDRLQDFEFMLRVGERTKKIIHVPTILYHWRRIPGSIAHDASSKGKIGPLQAAAVNAHFARIGFPGKAAPNEHLPHRLVIEPMPRDDYPSVDVIVRGDRAGPTIARCLAVLNRRRQHIGSISVLSLNPGQLMKATATRSAQIGGTENPPTDYSVVSTAAEIRKAITACYSRYIVFVDPLVEVRDDMWLDYLLLYVERDDIAFAAPHLYTWDGQVLAAGLLIGMNGLLPAMHRFRLGDDGFAGSLACNREVSALPAGMIIVDREILKRLGGLDPDFATPYYIFGEAAVRAMKRGYRNIAIANPILRVDDGYDLAEGSASDVVLFRDIHADVIRTGDPYYNINFKDGTGEYIT